jgi:hypothetical protein
MGSRSERENMKDWCSLPSAIHVMTSKIRSSGAIHVLFPLISFPI